MASYKNNFPGGSAAAPRPAPAAVSVKISRPIPADLFSDQALRAARSCASSKKANASTQLRRFYDELVMWHDKVFSDTSPERREERFRTVEPYVQMLRAKVAYAKGRELVDESFRSLFDGLIQQVRTPEDLRTARLFMEAFMGFKKCLEKTNNN